MVAPRPYNPNGPETFDLSSDFDMTGGGLLWYGRLQLLFRCTLCPTGARDRSLYREVSLAFFSTFEPVELTPDSIMQRQGVPMLYDSASCSALPSLYICHVKNILGRVPMIPCFVEGNSQPTIPHSFRRHELAGGAADGQSAFVRRGRQPAKRESADGWPRRRPQTVLRWRRYISRCAHEKWN